MGWVMTGVKRFPKIVGDLVIYWKYGAYGL